MTTTVTIDAHCASDKEVIVVITGEGDDENFTLQDGESDSRVVYDDREIHVKEVTK